MEVRLEKRYPLQVDVERAWAVLRDVRKVAGCMPGAVLTDQIDPTHYKGAIKVKVGPSTAQFKGDLEMVGLDEHSRRLQLHGTGADPGGSVAAMDMTAVVEPGDGPGASVLFGTSIITVSGKLAQFGGRMLGQVSDLILAQFVDNFRATAFEQASGAGTPAGEPAA